MDGVGVRVSRAALVGVATVAALTGAAGGAVAAAPNNDALADAQLISGISGQVTSSNNEATLEVGEPDHGKRGAFTLGAFASVWYRWTAPTSELVTFDAACAATPCLIPIVDAYTGSAVDALTVVPDATASYNGFTIQFDAVAGTTYSIAVAGRSFGGTGSFHLRWSNRPANDDFANPQEITGASGTLSASNVGATNEASEPIPSIGQLSASVWFSWTPASAGTSNFAVGGSDAGVFVGVYTGETLGALTLVAEAPNLNGSAPMPRVSFEGEVGTTYRIRVRGTTPGGRGTINLQWSHGAPANDIGSSWTSFNDPIHAQIVREMLVFPGLSVVGSNVGATKEPGEANHAGDPGGHSVWYSFQPTFAGASMTFDTVGSSFDTLLAVYEDGVLLVADDDSAGGGASRVTFTARRLNPNTPNPSLTEYLIAVDGKAGATGSVRLNWYLTTPSNDDFADAQQITGVSGLRTDDQNLGASIETDEPDHGFISFPHTGRFTGHSIWYEWTAPQDGSVTFSTFGSNGLGVLTFAPLIDVYTGASVDALSVVTPQTRPTSDSIQFVAAAGTTYKVVVAGLVPFSQGNVRLQWSSTFPFPERATTTAVECDSATTVGIPYQCEVTVTDVDSSPSSDGWRSDPTGVARIVFVGVTPADWGCTLIPDGNSATYSSSCSITQFPDAVPDPAAGTVEATYVEDSSLLHAASTDPDGFGPVTISARASTTEVVCAPSPVRATEATVCTATVFEAELAGQRSAPAGTVTFSASEAGTFADDTCDLVPVPLFVDPRSSCSVNYTPAVPGPQRVDATYATYATDLVHASSTDPDGFALQVDPKVLRATSTHVTCDPQRFRFGDETPICTATVHDVHIGGLASPPLGTVSLLSDHGGMFGSCALVASDSDRSACSATYSPPYYGFGSHHMGASYAGSVDHVASTSTDVSFVVLMRDTSTSVACDPSLVIGQASTCTVSVTDTEGDGSGNAPYDAVNVTAEGPGTLSASSCFLSNVASGSPVSECTVTYTPTGAGDGTHTITATYPGPMFGFYLPSTGSVDLPLATDNQAPVTTAQVIAGTAGVSPWYRSTSVTVRLSATDTGGSGVESITFSIDGSTAVVVADDSTDVVITGNALHSLGYYATDGAGNAETAASLPVGIDTVAPMLTVTGVTNGSTYAAGSVPAIGCTATDNLAAAGSLSGSPTLTVVPLPANAVGAHTATCAMADKAGNLGSKAAAYTVVAAPVDNITVRFTRAYSYSVTGPATSGNIVEGNRTLTGTVTVGAGVSVAVDCSNIRPILGLAWCRITVSAAALAPTPVVTTGLAAYDRTVLSNGRVRHEIDMVELRPVRVGHHTVWLPYRLQVTIVDAR